MISLDIIKKHLNIDSSFTDDDEILMLYAETAEHAVLKELDLVNEEDALDQYGDYKAEVLQSMLLLTGTLYSNREATTFGGVQIMPLAYQYLNMLNRDYSYRD